MSKIIFQLLFLLTIVHEGTGQISSRIQINFGTSYSTQQVKWFEEQQNQTNPSVRNSPNWRILYNIGINYRILNSNKIEISSGLKFQEKGSKNILINPFYPYYFERKYEVTKFLMVSGSIVYNVNKIISVYTEFTFGREILKPFPNYENEFAIVHGLKFKLYKKIGVSFGYNQGLTRLQYDGFNFKVRNISLDTNITYDF
jgi:hypothetical protein